jgi:threonine/homoserine/homoserine lactone efflux protein
MPDVSLGISDFGIPTAFLWIAFIVELTPGPNMAYLAALTLAEGRRAGFVTVAGIAMGLLLVSLLAAFEFAAESPMTTYVARGFLTNVLNPKAAVFFIAVLPQFIDPQHDTLRQTLRRSVTYAIVATFVHAIIVLLATYARPFFQNAARMNALRRVLALGLVAVAFWLLWSAAENAPA